MKVAEIRELQTSELQERLDAEVANYTSLRLTHAVSPLENPMKLKEVRRNIARMKTELRQRELNNK